MGSLAMARVLVQLSLRSIVAHWWKSLVVGGILLFGTALLVFGMTMLENVERSMRQSVTRSLIGDLQIHSDKGKDKPVFFDMFGDNQRDVGIIENFAEVRRVLERVDNVAAVIPMGLDTSMVRPGGNEFDRQIEALRKALRDGDQKTAALLRGRIIEMASLVREDLDRRAKIAKDKSELAPQLAVLDKVQGEAFWQALWADPEEGLFALETQLSPLQPDERAIYFGYIGTDVQRFASRFEQFQMVDGQIVPPGQRGILFNQRSFESQAKNKVAWELDELRKEVVKGGKRIADEPQLRVRVKKIQRMARRLLLEMSPEGALAMQGELQRALGGSRADAGALLERLVEIDDSNLLSRHALFYRSVATRIRLYKINVGDDVTLQVQTRSGYSKAATLKLWGTFRFKGLDDSPLAGFYGLMDMMTFRDLYGLLTPEKKRELDALRAEVGATEIKREDAEATLFGEGAEIEVAVKDGAFDDAPKVPALAAVSAPQPYTQADIEAGVVLNAAVILKDPSRMKETMVALRSAIDRHRLGLNIVSWEDASGAIGQFIAVLRGLLFLLVGIMFVVALVIINNSMLMATMDRIAEIGTMRAIGARRSFVLAMYLIETTVLGALAGLGGAAVAAIPIAIWHAVGLKAGHEMVAFAFGGPALHPTPSWSASLFGLSLIFGVSLLATIYPALVAMRVQPVVAMQSRE